MPDEHRTNGGEVFTTQCIAIGVGPVLRLEDLGEPSQVCEMCDQAEIRYVHTMKHQAYPITLEVGCRVALSTCENDYVNPSPTRAELEK